MKTRILLSTFETSSFLASAEPGDHKKSAAVALKPAKASLGAIEVPGHPGHFIIRAMGPEWPGPVVSPLNDW